MTAAATTVLIPRTRAKSWPGRGGEADRKSRGLPWLSPVPDCEPPFDDEIAGPARLRALPRIPPPGAVADHSMPAAPPEPDSRTRGRADPTVGHRPGGVQPALVSAREIPGWSRENDVGVRLTPSSALPRADRAGWMLAQALLEVLAGTRAVAQLREHCAPDVFAGIQDQRTIRGSRPPKIVTTRVGQHTDGVAEVTAVFRTAERVRALAFRIQGIDGRWRITHLQIG